MAQSMSEDPRVAALLRERDGYVRRGLPDRVAMVDDALRAYQAGPDSEPTTDPDPVPVLVDEPDAEPDKTPPRGRRSPGKHATTD